MLRFQPSLLIADLDGTLLHDGSVFETRYLSNETLKVAHQLQQAQLPLAIITARPVGSAFPFVQALHAKACAYLNGALLDVDCDHTTLEDLTSSVPHKNLIRFGFSSLRASQVCLSLLEKIPTLRIGIVMNDIRYTNFDVRILWKEQAFTYTNFHDIPEGTADKIIIVPRPEEILLLQSLLPEDFSLHISEDVLWMLTNPLANKGHALRVLCDYFQIKTTRTVTFGDDIIDIDMMKAGGYGVAVANSNPRLIEVADEVCKSNNDHGVACWIQSHLFNTQC